MKLKILVYQLKTKFHPEGVKDGQMFCAIEVVLTQKITQWISSDD